jgi:hypothetical protein
MSDDRLGTGPMAGGWAVRSIALMMEVARTSETSVDIQLRTRQYIPEDSELHTRRRESLKSHVSNINPFLQYFLSVI